MTQDELINDGWVPKNCKIGTLYFKGEFFGRIRGEVFELRCIDNDMVPIGNALTLKDIRDVQKYHYKWKVRECERMLEQAKEKLREYE